LAKCWQAAAAGHLSDRRLISACTTPTCTVTSSGSARSSTGLTRPDVWSRPALGCRSRSPSSARRQRQSWNPRYPPGAARSRPGGSPMAVTTQRGEREEGSGGAMLAAETALGATAVGPCSARASSDAVLCSSARSRSPIPCTAMGAGRRPDRRFGVRFCTR
jgi:hypothetical protein